MSNVRIIVAAVILVGCFTVIYPRFFHPVILKVLGMAPKVEKKHPTMHHPPNRPMHDGHGAPDPSMHIPDDVRRHMKPGPHPGMRAAAEMNKQSTRGSGGRGGIMGMVLPVYAIGIIAYLVYTLVKVFNKKGGDDYGKKSGRGSYGDRRQHLGSDKDGEEELTELDQLKESSEKLSVLENLLSKADDKNITSAEMSELQKRLEDTERQMARILHAMQTVSTKIDKNVMQEPDSTQGDKESEENKPEGQSRPEDKDTKPSNADVTQEKTTDTEKTEENKTDDEEVNKSKSCDEDTENIAEEDVVILDKQTDKKEEEKEVTTVRHRKTHVESDNS